MIVFNELVLEAGLCFPLYPLISHLLTAWDLSITQITPIGWSIILSIMTILGKADL